MPRKKRQQQHCVQNASKRWAPSIESTSSHTDFPSSEVVSTANLRIETLEDSFSEPKSQETCDFSPHYVLIDMQLLEELFRKVVCPDCYCNSLVLSTLSKFGFAHKVSLSCENCNAEKSSTYSSRRLSSSKGFDVNKRMSQAFLHIGSGHSAMEKFAMVMNMHSMAKKTFYKYEKELHKDYQITATNILTDIREKVKLAYLEVPQINENLHDDGNINISVSFDGSWHTRGHTSQIGVACCIDLFTGYILDFVVMSKYCQECSIAEKDLGASSPEFNFWYEGHKAKCDINHTGSSGAMEVTAADTLWRRSEANGFFYTTMLSDGDSKSFNHLVKENIYGSKATVTKEECINHVGKRLGTALRNVVKECKGKGTSIGGHKYGSLKQVTINKLTQYYERAIRNNKGDLPSMKSAIYATLYHAISTDSKPRHFKCPTGEDSWCFYQAAKAKGVQPGLHKEMVGTPINESYLPYVMPVYQRLAADSLLQRCMKCETQNANECIHSKIWQKCPKDKFATRMRVEIAVFEAVCEYNIGTQKTLYAMQRVSNLPAGCNTTAISRRKDVQRVNKYKKNSTAKFQRYRQIVKSARLRREQSIKKKEGSAYGAGLF